MKRICTFLFVMVIVTSLFAQVPKKMSYQTIIRNTSNHLVTETEVGIRISILQGSTDGVPVYVETHSPFTDGNGRVSIEIGTGATSDALSSVDWFDGPFYIKTETDPSGGTEYSITGISQLLAVPYAFYSMSAGTVNYNELLNLPELFDGDYNSVSGTPTLISDFELDANSQVIINLSDPVDPQDAVTKAYVDNLMNQLSVRITALENENIE